MHTILMKPKDFKRWHELKSNIDAHKERPPYFYEREIWFCSLGVNIGHEQNGAGINSLRPVIILKKISRDLCLVVPLSTKIKKHYFSVLFTFNNIQNMALISQIRIIDTKRLVHKYGTLNKNDFSIIKEKTKHLIALSFRNPNKGGGRSRLYFNLALVNASRAYWQFI
jgi:mRNA-degrading endonuclease toxin of MazEF toxin-antitoxin module